MSLLMFLRVFLSLQSTGLLISFDAKERDSVGATIGPWSSRSRKGRFVERSSTPASGAAMGDRT